MKKSRFTEEQIVFALKQAELRLIQPGNPTQNGFVESSNGRFRDDCLNEHWFSDVSHVWKTISEWRQDYNECRPHSALNYQTPSKFAAAWRRGNSESKGSDINNRVLYLILGAGHVSSINLARYFKFL
jgi:transposase InsO family protein